MTLKATIDQDLRDALKNNDRIVCDTLRLLKAEIANTEIALGLRQTGLSESQIEQVVLKESKKRREASELYKKAGRSELAEKEEQEAEVLAKYLPKMLGEDEVRKLIEEVLGESALEPIMPNMGKIIGAVKAKAGTSVDGAMLAKLVKERVDGWFYFLDWLARARALKCRS